MKKLVIISLTVLFSIVLSLFIFFYVKTNDLKIKNKNLENEITVLSDENKMLNEENTEYEQKVNNLKTEKEASIKEVNIWKETKEKIEKALS